MTFDWLIRHQKKILFILAAVLIVGWGFGSVITRLMPSRGGGGGPNVVVARVAGQDMTSGEYDAFCRAWGEMFPNFAQEIRYSFGPDVSVGDALLAVLTLSKMAEQCHIGAGDELVETSYRQFVQERAGREISDRDELDAFIRKRYRTGPGYVRQVLRRQINANLMISEILAGIRPTDLEALEKYLADNRRVRVRYVSFAPDDYMDGVAEPTEDEIKAYYDENKGPRGPYFTPTKAVVESVQAKLADFEPRVAVTVEEMQKYYDDRKDDLYRVFDAAKPEDETEPAADAAKKAEEGETRPAATYRPFVEVKPEIEQAIKRAKATAEAVLALNDARRLFAENPQGTLEAHAKQVNGKLGYEGLKYARTPFVTEIELLETPVLGDARAPGGERLVELAFRAGAMEAKTIDEVLSTPDSRLIFRTADVKPETTPALSDIAAQVALDLRRKRAMDKAQEAAKAFAGKVREDAGEDALVKAAADAKFAVQESPLFRNNYYDAARPGFVSRDSALKMGEVYGPWDDMLTGTVAVLKVFEETKPDLAAFKAERALNRELLAPDKRMEYMRATFPRAILAFGVEKVHREGEDMRSPARDVPPPPDFD